MNPIDVYLKSPVLASTVAAACLALFAAVNHMAEASAFKGRTLMIIGFVTSVGLASAICALLLRVSRSGLDDLWVVFRFSPAIVLTILALWVGCLPAAFASDFERARGSWRIGVGLSLLIALVSVVLCGLAFAIDALLVVVPSILMARSACLSPFLNPIGGDAEPRGARLE